MSNSADSAIHSNDVYINATAPAALPAVAPCLPKPFISAFVLTLRGAFAGANRNPCTVPYTPPPSINPR